MKNCPQCKTDFEPIAPKMVYCSDKCRLRAFRSKRKKPGAKRGRPARIKLTDDEKLMLDLMDKIIEIQNEQIPPGKGQYATWKQSQKDRIEEIKKQFPKESPE